MTTEQEKEFFEVFEIPKIFKTTINTGDLDLNYVEIQAPTLKELYEEAQYDLDTPIYFSWFKRSKRWSEEYPEISDKQYLELICIIADNMSYFKITGVKDKKLPCSELKKGILYLLINTQNENVGLLTTTKKEDIKHQVQAIFEGKR